MSFSVALSSGCGWSDGFYELWKYGVMHAPVDAHGLVVARRNVVHKSETVEWTGIPKSVFLVLTHKQYELLLVRGLFHKTFTTALVCIGVL